MLTKPTKIYHHRILPCSNLVWGFPANSETCDMHPWLQRKNPACCVGCDACMAVTSCQVFPYKTTSTYHVYILRERDWVTVRDVIKATADPCVQRLTLQRIRTMLIYLPNGKAYELQIGCTDRIRKPILSQTFTIIGGFLVIGHLLKKLIFIVYSNVCYLLFIVAQ